MTFRGRVTSRLAALAAAVGSIWMAWPALTAPVTSDSRYHYMLAHRYLDGSVWNALSFTVHDMEWRATRGRIAPTGVFIEVIQYFLGLKLAIRQQWSFAAIEGLTKVGLLLLVILGLHLLLGALRVAGNRRGKVTLIFATLLVSGVTASTVARNGWTTFTVLCIGSAALTLAAAAAVLSASYTWERRKRWVRMAQLVGLAGLGVFLALYYEMTAVAVATFVGVTMAALWWQARRANLDLPPLLPAAALVGANLLTVVVTRRILAHVATDNSYAGLQPNPSWKWPQAALAELIAPLPPATGFFNNLREDGMSYWDGVHLGVASLVGLVTMAALLLATTNRRGRAGTGAVTSPAVSPSRAAQWAAWPHAARALLIAALFTSVAVALAMSLSAGAQQVMEKGWGVTYRGTPLIWSMYALAATILLVWALERTKVSTYRLLLVGVLSWGVLVGTTAYPTGMATIRDVRARDISLMGAQIQDVIVAGPRMNEEHRCETFIRASAATTGKQAKLRARRVLIAYRSIWGHPLCQTYRGPGSS